MNQQHRGQHQGRMVGGQEKHFSVGFQFPSLPQYSNFYSEGISMYVPLICCFHQLHNSCTALANNWCCCWSMQYIKIRHHPQRENVSHNSSLSLSISHIHSIHDPSPPCVTQSQGCMGKLSFEPLGFWWSQLVTWI